MDDLLSEIEAFRRTHGMAESAFGRKAANDTNFIKQVRSGRELRRATIERVRLFMLTYRPEMSKAA